MLFPAIVANEVAATTGKPAPPICFGSVAGPTNMMEFEHKNAGAALLKIRSITKDFELPEYACVTFRALMSSFDELEHDLHLHIHLENNILFPRAEQMEVVYRQKQGRSFPILRQHSGRHPPARRRFPQFFKSSMPASTPRVFQRRPISIGFDGISKDDDSVSVCSLVRIACKRFIFGAETGANPRDQLGSRTSSTRTDDANDPTDKGLILRPRVNAAIYGPQPERGASWVLTQCPATAVKSRRSF